MLKHEYLLAHSFSLRPSPSLSLCDEHAKESDGQPRVEDDTSRSFTELAKRSAKRDTYVPGARS